MGLLFSKITATAGDAQKTFLVAGIPREYADLEGWTAFEDFLSEIDQDTDIQIQAKAYLYGKGETLKATPAEIAYFMNRMRLDGDFLDNRCDHIETVHFDVQWSSKELFGQAFTTK